MADYLTYLLSPDRDAYKGFLEVWRGPRKPEYGIPPGALPSPLPKALCEFLGYVGRWPELFMQNHLIVPPRPEPESGRIVFYLENQSVARWATLPEGDDPPVWVDYEAPWIQEGEPLSRFLLQALLVEAIMRGPLVSNANGLDEGRTRRALAPFTRLPLAPWSWPLSETTFYAGPSTIATSGSYGDGTFEVWVSSREPSECEHLDALPDEVWSCYWREFLGSRDWA